MKGFDFINQKAITKYGVEAQSVVAMEECAELIKEISKAYRGKLNKDGMSEEIADVLICVEQLKMMYNIADEDVKRYKREKMQRLLERLGE